MSTTQYGVQAFNRRGKTLHPETPDVGTDEKAALRKGERMAEHKSGVVVYRVQSDEWLGDVDEPVIIARHGELPPHLAEPSF